MCGLFQYMHFWDIVKIIVLKSMSVLLNKTFPFFLPDRDLLPLNLLILVFLFVFRCRRGEARWQIYHDVRRAVPQGIPRLGRPQCEIYTNFRLYITVTQRLV